MTAYEYGTSETNTYGMPTKTTVKNADGSMQSYIQMFYTANYNYLTRVVDSRNGTTLYNYDVNSGQLMSTTDPNGNVTTYTYDENTGALLSTSGNSNASTSTTNSYTYTDDALTSIAHNGFSYGFNYDKYGRALSNTVAGRTLITNSYNANGTLAGSTYGNGAVKSYTYDELDRITTESYNGVKTYSYDYNKENLVYSAKDYETPDSGYIETKYDYDLARRITGVTLSNGAKADYVYDERNNLKSMVMTVNGETVAESEYTYKPDGLVNTATVALLRNSVITYEHDALNRLTKKSMHVPGLCDMFVDYTYLSNDTNQTGLVSQMKHTTSTYSGETKFDYTYDANGNIKTVSYNDVLQDTYTYDGLNQLIRHDDAKANKSYTYTYDLGGNILSKSEYAYTTDTLGTATNTINYTYDSTWKDLMLSYDGKTVTYDEIGNPLTYDGNTFTWQKGRQLASISNSDYNLQFRYGSDGKRTKKIVGDKTVEYYYSGDILVAQYDGTDWLMFSYSADGEIIGFSRNNTDYFYIKNLQGDVIAVTNASGRTLGKYNYDAWGNIVSITYSAGTEITDETHIAHINPIRYRGYYYDSETDLYYLNSRYYNPEWGRFINADGYASTGQGLTGTNMFAYCGNNPVKRTDSSGAFWETAIDVVSLCVSVAEVYANPMDPWAWAGLAGDAIDLIPFVSGIGEFTKVCRITVKAVDNTDDVIKATRKLYNSLDVSSGIKKFNGSYEIVFESKTVYTGKGGFYRSTVSAKYQSIKHNDRVTSISWTPSSSIGNAYIAEYHLMKKKGVKNKNTYNQIWSPGRKQQQALWLDIFER